MERVIHPIGQGAFYSEQFENFTIVYDCGEWRKTRKAQQVVDRSFSFGSEIDILFISHFDFDHISLIPILKQNCQIKLCILPVINNIEKIIITNIYKALGKEDLATLVTNPKDFFGPTTKIIYIDILNNNQIIENLEIDGVLRKRRIDSLIDEEYIPSGTELSFSEIDWVFVPYNIEHTERRNELINTIKKHNLIIRFFSTEYNVYIENEIDEIRKVYSSLHGGINSNSMYLYSGPAKKDVSGFISILEFYYKKFFQCEYRTGCVYTGDGKLFEVKKIYKNYWHTVGTIQLPHHGSGKNFDYKFFSSQKERYIFFASFGNNNSYGHPSKDVIINIHNNNSDFFPVSETVATEFVEVIRNNF